MPRANFTAEELERRRQWVRWFSANEWDPSVTDEFMLRDNPSEAEMKDLIHRHGPEEAHRMLLQHILDKKGKK